LDSGCAASTIEAKMNASKVTLKGVAIILSLGFLSEISHGQIYLTGLLQVGTGSNGNSAGSPIFNTLGNEISYANIYLTQPNGGYAAPFLNSGNGAGASIAYALTPGTYQFYFFTVSFFGNAPGSPNNPGYYDLSLFFDGNNNSSPGIAAYSPAGVISANAVPAMFSTLPLSGNTNSPSPAPGTLISTVTPLPAPGSLTYVADGLSVTLTDYGYGSPGVIGGPAWDRVSNLDSVPDGYASAVGVFDLTVAAVPEPSIVSLFVAVFAVAVLRRSVIC
jgi:hypothetical protein